MLKPQDARRTDSAEWPEEGSDIARSDSLGAWRRGVAFGQQSKSTGLVAVAAGDGCARC